MKCFKSVATEWEQTFT